MRIEAGEELKRMNYLFSETDAVYHEAARRFGLSDSTMTILYAACNYGGSCLLSELTHMTGASKQTINSALRRLESEDILYLEMAGSRKKRICLTEKGRELAQQTVLRLMQGENEILRSWTEEEREQYLLLTQRYLNDLRKVIGSF
ncbi:MAG: MarR family transcriptional regulator [Eubacteriales bacterium]|nr:MarR family transcriptional regulator [Eubacteriales bacterium]